MMHGCKPVGLMCPCINENVGCRLYILHPVLDLPHRAHAAWCFSLEKSSAGNPPAPCRSGKRTVFAVCRRRASQEKLSIVC